jgi:hypothetical protein
VQTTGPGVGFIDMGIDFGSGYNITWTNMRLFTMGDASQYAATFRSNGVVSSLLWTGGAADTSGQVVVGLNGNATDAATISGVTFKNSTHLGNEVGLGTVNPTGGAARIFTNNVVDGVLSLGSSGWTISGNFLQFQIFEASGMVNTISGNLVTPPCSGVVNTLWTAGSSPIDGNYLYFCQDNPHGIGMVDSNVSITHNVFEEDFLGGTDPGDYIFPAAGAIVTNNLVIQTQNRGGELLSAGVPHSGVIEKNNTIVGMSAIGCGAHIGETTNSAPNMFSVYRNNVCVHKDKPGVQLQDVGTVHATQAVTDADYNSGWNMAAGSAYLNMPGTYGAHDIVADPQFVDGARSMSSWGATLGCDGTAACAMAQLAKINDATGYNPAFTIAALIAHVKAGYYPTNPLFKNAGSPADGSPDLGAFPVVAPTPVVTSTVNTTGHGIKVNFPGRYAVEIGAGDLSNTGEYKGLAGLWDLKNNSTQQYNWCGLYVGCAWTKMDWTNADTTDRYPSGGSASESPGTVTLVENNALRVQVKYHFQMRRYGTDAVDCCLSADEYFTMEYPDKVYRTMKVSYTGADGLGPLKWNFFEMIPNNAWARASNEPTTVAGVLSGPAPCIGSLVPATPSPWLFMWQDPPSPTDRPKTWSLYSTAGTSPYPPSNDCAGTGNPGLPTVGTVSHCTNVNCVGGGVNYQVPLKTNVLAMAGPVDTYVYPFGVSPQYFEGGIRMELGMQNVPSPLTTGTDVYSHYVSMRVGDNGITSNATAEEYATEYHGVVAPTMTTGTLGTGTDVTNGFDLLKGAYVMTATSGVSFTTHNIQHYPVFQVVNWTAEVPSTITVGGSSKSLGAHYSAVKLDASTLLLQYLAASVPDATTWTINQTGTGTCETTTGTCYYVDMHSGSGAGTFGDPFGLADLANPGDGAPGTAFQALQPGDYLYFRAGTYSAVGSSVIGYYDKPYFAPVRSGSSGNPITIKAYPGEAVTLTYAGGAYGVPVIGSREFSYIRIIGFTVDVSNSASLAIGVSGMQIGNAATPSSNQEIAYNKVIGGSCSLCSSVDANYQAIMLQNTTSAWIHHNELGNFTATAFPGNTNAAGLKLYKDTNAIIEDNWVHDNCMGIFDKDSGTSGSYNTYRRNYLTANTIIQFIGANQGVPATHFIYDNVIDGALAPIWGSPAQVFGNNQEIHNNLFRGSNTASLTPFIEWGNAGQVTNLKIWNNIEIANGTNVPIMNTTQTLAGPPSAIVAYSDQNVYDSAPTWFLNFYGSSPQTLGVAGMQDNGFEKHSFVIPVASLFVDQIAYVVKPPYTTNGRYGDTMGPKGIATATILDTSRYGPQASTGPTTTITTTQFRGVFSGSVR